MYTNVSVVMAVYNTKEEYLRSAIDSILAQTYKDFEFIIINDGSTNNAEEVILSYSDERIKYYKQENKGLPKSLNFGIETAQGEYIARMDSDDIALPNRLEKEINFLKENPEYSVVGSLAKIIPRNEVVKLIEKPKLLDFFYKCWIIHPTVMFRKEDFIKYNLKYNEKFLVAQDYELWSRAVKVLKFYNIQDILLYYRIEGQGNATKRRNERIQNAINIQQNILNSLTYDKKLQNLIIKEIHLKQKINKDFKEQIFSIKNSFEFNKEYKVITLFGMEIKILRKIWSFNKK